MLNTTGVTTQANAPQSTPNSEQQNQLLGTPSLQSFSSPYFNSSYGGPPSSFALPSSIPVPNQQQPQQAGNINQMVRALQGNRG